MAVFVAPVVAVAVKVAAFAAVESAAFLQLAVNWQALVE